MHGLEPGKSTAEQFESFAAEVREKSPLYERLCMAVAGDGETLALLDRLPPRSRQPNLLLAAVRYLFGTPRDHAEFRAQIHERWSAVEATLLTRRTQTNEPGRCAPVDACLVIMHTAVLAYLPAAQRDDFSQRVGRLGSTWLSVEAPAASPGGTQRWGEHSDGAFLLVRDGDRLLATCDSHGGWLRWR